MACVVRRMTRPALIPEMCFHTNLKEFFGARSVSDEQAGRDVSSVCDEDYSPTRDRIHARRRLVQNYDRRVADGRKRDAEAALHAPGEGAHPHVLHCLEVDGRQPLLHGVGHVLLRHAADAPEQLEMLPRGQVGPEEIVLLALPDHLADDLRFVRDRTVADEDVAARRVLRAAQQVDERRLP